MLVALLGQQRRFEMSDFINHVITAQELDPKDETISGVVSGGTMEVFLTDLQLLYTILNTQYFLIVELQNIKTFCQFGELKRRLSGRIFAVLDRFLASSEEKVPVLFIPPPSAGHDITTV